MSLVDIHDGTVFLGSLYHRRQISHIARHTEDTIHDDQTSGLLGDSFEAIAEGIHRVVTVGNQLGWSDLASLNDRCMVLTVAENKVIGFGQCCKSPLVGKETGGEQKGAFTTKERGQRLLQLIMERDRAIQETGTGAAGSELAGRIDGRLDNPGILSQAEVVVRADHDLLLAAANDMIPVALLDATEIGVESLGAGVRGISILSALLE